MEQMKPRYLYELLLLLHRTVTASQGQVLVGSIFTNTILDRLCLLENLIKKLLKNA